MLSELTDDFFFVLRINVLAHPFKPGLIVCFLLVGQSNVQCYFLCRTQELNHLDGIIIPHSGPVQPSALE